MRPARGKLLVSLAATEETIPGGLIILPDQARAALAANQVRLLSSGPPALCLNKHCRRPHVPLNSNLTHPLPLPPNAWLLTRPRALLSTQHPAQFLIHQDDILAILYP